MEGENGLKDFWISFWSGFKSGASNVLLLFALIGLIGAFTVAMIFTIYLIFETFGIIGGVLFVILLLSIVVGICFGIKVWTIYRKLKEDLEKHKELLAEEKDVHTIQAYEYHISRVEGKIKRLLSGNYNEFFR